MNQTELLDRLRVHLDAGSTDMAPSSLRVPASHYVCEKQGAEEVEALFIKRPLLVALTPNFPSPGDYFTHEALNRSLLLVRGKDGSRRQAYRATQQQRWF